MSCDLDVDTEHIRLAAVQARHAAETMAASPAGRHPTGLSDLAAGGSAPARQALRLAITRFDQATRACADLSAVAASLADRLTQVAAVFEQAEVLCRAGG